MSDSPFHRSGTIVDDSLTKRRSEQFEEIVGLCTQIGDAVKDSDWDAAARLLKRRHGKLEAQFAAFPTTPGEVGQLISLAEHVMAFDKALMPGADSARAEVAGKLKKLRRSRKAADIYRDNAG